ncbi:phosphoketolase family protein [Microbacterium sp. SSW1-59]|uniref:phosphoketolase family protein n=1 Tax=Microbacterium xanthum TaxID=3079794 RepID=UPI002AD42B12|nr:phosphoketolase family protein [Microbacterium sp. SSW1-59]MDZ8199929.1 phosphoketolase family protein [Microbacterium sp. SSW1-59]
MASHDIDLARLDAWWRAANYLSVGQIYLLDNPLLRRPLAAEHVKPRLLGHFGTVPGLTFTYAHANRVIRARDLDAMFIAGPGHGGPGMVAAAWLDGTYSELYPEVTRDTAGMRRLFRQFSFPGGIPSHAAPDTPGSIHEGGELGYSLSHAYGAVFDNPELTVFCVVGDGEAETGPLATGWHGNKFVDPRTDGTVVPILHLNGWKIANPTLLARIPESELADLLRGYGHEPIFVTIDAADPHEEAHRRMADAMDEALDAIAQQRSDLNVVRPRTPMIVLRSPKGWTGPVEVDGNPVQDTWRAHQVPVDAARDDDAHRRILEDWMRSYGPEDLFDDDGRPVDAIDQVTPEGARRMSANPHANGGLLRRELDLPDIADHLTGLDPEATERSAMGELGHYLAQVIERNPTDFRLFGPDETASNRLAPAVFDASGKRWNAGSDPRDENLSRTGRIMEVLSEHQGQGWLEGYLLTGRHGLFATYEAFAHIVDSMFNQHAKWLESASGIPWREPVSSSTYLLSSHVWQQDHNGFTHQDPGFLDLAVNKRADIVRVYLPPDANTLVATVDHCLRTTDRMNVIVAGKQPAPQWFTPDEAVRHLEHGASRLAWAGTDADGVDAVLACAGDVPSEEVIAAARLLREEAPGLRVRVVNVIDLMRLQTPSQHPHGMDEKSFDELFPPDVPTVFAFHGYPWLVHRLAYRRAAHAQLHVRGYIERGTTTTPFDMRLINDIDRYRLAADVLDRVPGAADRHAALRAQLDRRREEARAHTRDHGVDHPAVGSGGERHISPTGAVQPIDAGDAHTYRRGMGSEGV